MFNKVNTKFIKKDLPVLISLAEDDEGLPKVSFLNYVKTFDNTCLNPVNSNAIRAVAGECLIHEAEINFKLNEPLSKYHKN